VPEPPIAPRHNTAETYQKLLNIEVKSLITRIAELTGQVDKIFTEVAELMINTEDMLSRVESLGTSLAFNRTELADLKKQQTVQAVMLRGALARLQDLENHLAGSVVKESVPEL
jgi:hypothetical protein